MYNGEFVLSVERPGAPQASRDSLGGDLSVTPLSYKYTIPNILERSK